MANAPPLTQMRAQFNSLIDAGWGKNFILTRFSGSPNAAGHLSGSFATVSLFSGERIWIQALAGRSSIDTKNLDAETTHLAFQKISGATALIPKDRVLPSGATYVYDVINTEVFETHRMSQLKQDLRS
jgi:hypothetical protein